MTAQDDVGIFEEDVCGRYPTDHALDTLHFPYVWSYHQSVAPLSFDDHAHTRVWVEMKTHELGPENFHAMAQSERGEGNRHPTG